MNQSKEGSMRSLSLVIALCFLPATLWPQASSSTVRGTVHDQAHAVIPKAKVTLNNTATNAARTTETNESGIYVFPVVIPGPYRLVGGIPGIPKFQGALTVLVQNEAAVDTRLQVGPTG